MSSLERFLRYSQHPILGQCISKVKIGGERLSPYTFGREQRGEWKIDRHTDIPHSVEEVDEWADREIKPLADRYKDESNPPHCRHTKREQESQSTLDSVLYKDGDQFVLDQGCLACGFDETAVVYEKDVDDKTRANRFRERLRHQKRMELERLDLDLLTRNFKNLTRLRTIKFYDSGSSPGSYDLAVEGCEIYGAGTSWRCHVFQTVLQACAMAGCGLSAIVAKNNFDDEGVAAWAFNDLDLLIFHANFMSLVQDLKDLRLERLRAETTLDALPPILEHATQLEELDVHCIGGTKVYKKDFILLSKLQKLRSFALTGIDNDCNMLVPWLRSSSASIARIRLENIDLLQGHWIGFLESLRSIGFDKLLLRASRGGDQWGRDRQAARRGQRHQLRVGLGPKRSELCDYVRRKTSTNPYIEFWRVCIILDDDELETELSSIDVDTYCRNLIMRTETTSQQYYENLLRTTMLNCWTF